MPHVIAFLNRERKLFERVYNYIKDKCCCSEIHLIPAKKSKVFLHNVRTLYASALGIDILCMMSAEIEQNLIFMMSGFQTPFAIIMSYVIGMVLQDLLYLQQYLEDTI